MKKFNCIILKTLLIFVAFLTSCVDFNDEPDIPTREEENALLKTYLNNLSNKGFNIDTTSTGIYYIVIDKGEGPNANTGDTLTVGYSGYFINGYMFDSSSIFSEEGKWKFVLGNPPMIKGWEEGMKLMNKNAKLQIIVPSELAYGSGGSGTIPAYQTLVFVVKMFDIKPKK